MQSPAACDPEITGRNGLTADTDMNTIRFSMQGQEVPRSVGAQTISDGAVAQDRADRGQ